MYQEVLHALKLLYICIRYLIEECPLLLWGDNSLSDIVRLVNEHLYFLHIYTSNHLLCTYTMQSVIHLKGGGNINLGIYVHPDC